MEPLKIALGSFPGGSALLSSGFHIPLIGLGTYKITGQETVSTAVDAALAAGYRMFDTAKYYNNERELGIVLEEMLAKHALKREDIFVTTKFFPESMDQAAGARRLVHESLELLKLGYLDLVLVHYPKPNDNDYKDPRNAEARKLTYIELEAMKDEGLIRSVGVANYEICHLEEIKKYGRSKPVLNQQEFHPHFTRSELRDYCKKEGIFFQAFSSLARHEPKLLQEPELLAIAKDHSISPEMVLLAWPLNQGIGIVPKSTSPQRIAENFRVVDVKLTKEEIDRLGQLNRDQHYIRCDGWNVV